MPFVRVPVRIRRTDPGYLATIIDRAVPVFVSVYHFTKLALRTNRDCLGNHPSCPPTCPTHQDPDDPAGQHQLLRARGEGSRPSSCSRRMVCLHPPRGFPDFSPLGHGPCTILSYPVHSPDPCPSTLLSTRTGSSLARKNSQMISRCATHCPPPTMPRSCALPIPLCTPCSLSWPGVRPTIRGTPTALSISSMRR
jgi:hypothetical protein